MKYLKSSELEKCNDKVIIYVNRNILNTTIATYEIHIDTLQCEEELNGLLKIWKKTYEIEKQSKRFTPYVEMTSGEVKKYFKNYETFPTGSFCSLER